MSHKMPFP